MTSPHQRDTDLQHLHPLFREKVVAVLEKLAEENIPFRIFEGFRTPQRQQYLYAQGRTRPGQVVTRAKAWQSNHQYGVAADFVLYLENGWSWDDSGPRSRWWTRLHEIGRQQGLHPLSFEMPHLELAGVSVGDLQAGRYPPDGDLSWAENLEAAIVSWSGTPAAPPAPSTVPARPPIAEARDESLNLTDIQTAGTQDWHSRFGGIEWRYDQDGVYVRETAGGREPLHTPGEPLTCRAIWRLFAEHVLAAARKYGISPELIMMTIATETAFAARYGFTGSHTFRWEANVEVTDVNPPIFGDYSAGPMQTLATTARWIIRQQHLPYDPFVVAPVYRSRPSPPETHPLYDPARNIDLGTAEIKQRWNATGDDPVLVAAAFNAGGLYRNNQNRWHLRSYGDHLGRAVKWYGDACSVLADLRT